MFWKEIAVYFAMAFSALTAWAWRDTHAKVKEKADAGAVVLLAAAVREKADAALVEGVIGRIEVIATNQREDNRQIFTEIKQVADTHARFAEKVMEELGRRPSREEIQWQNHVGKKDG